MMALPPTRADAAVGAASAAKTFADKEGVAKLSVGPCGSGFSRECPRKSLISGSPFAAEEGVAKLSVAPLWERIYPRMTPQVIDLSQSIRG